MFSGYLHNAITCMVFKRSGSETDAIAFKGVKWWFSETDFAVFTN